METLAPIYTKVLLFVEKYDRKHDAATICRNTFCENTDIYYLIDDKYLKWHSYDIPTLDAKGRNFLASWRELQVDKHTIKQDIIKTRRIAV